MPKQSVHRVKNWMLANRISVVSSVAAAPAPPSYPVSPTASRAARGRAIHRASRCMPSMATASGTPIAFVSRYHRARSACTKYTL